MPFKKYNTANPLKIEPNGMKNYMSPSPSVSPSTSPSPPDSIKYNQLKSSLAHFSLLDDISSSKQSDSELSHFKSKLYDLFNQIEHEFDLLYTENKRLIKLNQKLQNNSLISEETTTKNTNSKFNTLSSTSTLVHPDNTTIQSDHESLNKSTPTKQNETSSIASNTNSKNSKLTSSFKLSQQTSSTSKSTLLTSKARINNLSFPKFKPNAREFIMQSIKNTSAQIVNKTNNNVIQSKLQCSLTGHTDGIWDISIQPVPNHLINNYNIRPTKLNTNLLIGTASADTTARLWYLNSQINNALSPSSQTHLQMNSSGFCVQNYCGHTGSVNSIRFHPKFFTEATNLILTASGDAQAHIWQSVLSPIQDSLESTSDVVLNYTSCYSIARNLVNSSSVMSPNNVASILGNNYKEMISNVATIRSPIRRYEGHTDTLIAAEWFPDGEFLCTGSWDRTANVYNVETGKVLCNLQHDDNLTNVNIHKTNKIILTSSRDCTFKIWDFRDPICSVNVYQGHSRSVNSAIFVNEDKLATSSDDQTLKLWDLRIMRSPLFTINTNSGVNRICTMNGPISQDSQLNSDTVLCLPLDNRDVKIYNLNGERIHRLPRNNRIGHKRLVTSLASYGNLLLSASFDKQINCWSLDYNSVKSSKLINSNKENNTDHLVSSEHQQMNLSNQFIMSPTNNTSITNGCSPGSSKLVNQSNQIQSSASTHVSNLTSNSLKGINALSKFIKI